MDAHLFISNGEAHRFSIDEMFKYLQKFDLRINGLQAHFGVLAMMYRVLLKLNSPRVTVGTERTGKIHLGHHSLTVHGTCRCKAMYKSASLSLVRLLV